MPDLFSRLRDLVWPAVGATVFTLLALILAFTRPERPIEALTLALAGVTMGLLAQRA
jgi:hypothetical protein